MPVDGITYDFGSYRNNITVKVGLSLAIGSLTSSELSQDDAYLNRGKAFFNASILS